MSQRKDELEQQKMFQFQSSQVGLQGARKEKGKNVPILGEKEATPGCGAWWPSVRESPCLLPCCTFVLFSKGRRAVLFSKQATTATERITVGERGPVDIVEAGVGGHVESML